MGTGLFRYYAGALTAILLATIGVLLYKRRRYAHTLSTHNSPPTEDHPRCHVNSRSLLNAYKVTVVNTVEECERFLQSCVSGPVRVVGLDCEWRGPGYLSRNQHPGDDCESEESESEDCPVALLQLAFPNGEVALVRLCRMSGIGQTLRDLLTNRRFNSEVLPLTDCTALCSVLKFGVGIGNDVSRLAAAIGVVTAGCVDLQHIAVRCGIRSGTSLRGLSHQLLGLTMDKTFHLRCGDWEAKQLSQDQVDYAALDAIIALHILQAFVDLKVSKQDRRETSRHNHTSRDQPAAILIGQSLEAWLDNENHHPCLLSLCQGVIDVKFKQQKLSKTSKNLENGVAPVVKRTSAYSVRKSRLYHNCRLLAPDGQLLSTMHRRKLEWYLERGLGTLVCESPMTVQLHFEPGGRPGADREYYLRDKENICTVCGSSQNCVRKNIIPHEYRKHFPALMKEHLSHDVLLLCVTCHQLASHHGALLKQQVAAEHDLYANTTSQKFKEDSHLKRIKNHARVLLKDTAGIPEERLHALQDSVAGYHQVERYELTTESIQAAATIDPRSPNHGYVSHSEVVVATLLAEGGEERLVQFQRRWRQHFLDTMNPQHLPQCWSVDHNPARS